MPVLHLVAADRPLVTDWIALVIGFATAVASAVAAAAWKAASASERTSKEARDALVAA